MNRWGEVSGWKVSGGKVPGDGERADGLPSFARLVRRLTRPRLCTVESTTLLDAPVPPALAELVTEKIDFMVSQVEHADQALVITCFERACRLGMAGVNIRFQGSDAPSLLTIVDLATDLGVLAYLVSEDAVPADRGPEPAIGPQTEATASVILTPGGKIVEVYGAIPRVIGAERGDVLGESIAAYVHPDDVAAALSAFAEALSDHRIGRRLRARLRTVDGGWRWLDSTLHAGAHGPGGEVYVSCSLTDVEADVRARAALTESEDRFRMLAESIPIGVFGADDEGRIRYANQTFRDITGLESDTGPESNDPEWLDLAHPDDRVGAADALQRFGIDGDVLDVELRLRPLGATEYRTARVLARAIRAEDGKLVDVVGSMEDITDRKAMQVRLAYDASHDALTGLANRTRLVEDLSRRLASSHSGRDPLAVLFVDLDGFKRVNDSLGHTAGDQLLLTLAERLQGQARANDLVSRFGGDEFVLVAEQTGGPDGALGMAHRVLQALSAPAEVGGTLVRPRASIGVALATDANADSETLLRDADAAMYEAKARGPNGVWLADAAVRSRADRRFGLEGAIADALLGDEYRLDYQPILDLADGRVFGAEGLLRWDSHEFGLTLPDEIIPLTEEAGLIHHLTEWTVRRAGRDLLAMRETLRLVERFHLGINLSCAQLSSPDFLPRYLGVLDAVGVEAADLVVEVTETERIEQSSAAEHALVALAEAGALLAVDDFGSGYSSFDYLTRMPVTFLKIDRRLTEQLPTNARARRVLRGLASMCTDMGIAVIAEGIETEAERDAYLEIGIQRGQGYLFAKAMTVDRLVDHLRADADVGG